MYHHGSDDMSSSIHSPLSVDPSLQAFHDRWAHLASESSITDLAHKMHAHNLSSGHSSTFDSDSHIRFDSPFSPEWKGFSSSVESRLPTPSDDFSPAFPTSSASSHISLSRASSFEFESPLDDSSTHSAPSPTGSSYAAVGEMDSLAATPPASPPNFYTTLPSWAAPSDPAWDLPLHPRRSMTSIRRQRQEALRKQASASHLREIEALVARMVEGGEQCSVCARRTSPTSATEYPSDRNLRAGDTNDKDTDDCASQEDLSFSAERILRKQSITSSTGSVSSRRDSFASRTFTSSRVSKGISKLDRRATTGPHARRKGGYVASSGR